MKLFCIRIFGKPIWTRAYTEKQAQRYADFKMLDLTKYKAEGIL